MIRSLAKFLPLIPILFLPGALSAETRDPGPFYGFWETLEPAGDTFVINVKRGNRASGFYTRSSASRIIKGTWVREGDRLVTTWESGHKDALVRLDNGTFEREAYQPGQDVAGEPNYSTRATHIDPRIPGSLGVQRDNNSRLEAHLANESPETERPMTDVPIRNDYNGYWKVHQGSGGFLGIGARGSDSFYLLLQRNGTVRSALRRWDLNSNAIGEWAFENDSAVITWPNGQRDVLQDSGDQDYSLLVYGSSRKQRDNPDNVMAAERSSAEQAAQLFNVGDIRMFTMSDIRGAWVPANSLESPEQYIQVEGWGRARRYPAGAGSANGEWKLFNDRVVITWDDGSKDVLRADLRGWVQESFPPGVPASGTPSKSISVRRVQLDELNLSRSD